MSLNFVADLKGESKPTFMNLYYLNKNISKKSVENKDSKDKVCHDCYQVKGIVVQHPTCKKNEKSPCPWKRKQRKNSEKKTRTSSSNISAKSYESLVAWDWISSYSGVAIRFATEEVCLTPENPTNCDHDGPCFAWEISKVISAEVEETFESQPKKPAEYTTRIEIDAKEDCFENREFSAPIYLPRGQWDVVTDDIAYCTTTYQQCTPDGRLCNHSCRCYPWDDTDNGTIVDPDWFSPSKKGYRANKAFLLSTPNARLVQGKQLENKNKKRNCRTQSYRNFGPTNFSF